MLIKIDAQKDLERARKAIDELDLECIKFKLVDNVDGEGWSRTQANNVESWYRRFLFLNYKYTDQPIVVDKLLDTFWHYHILDTLKYSDDCNAVFGRFLHHFPYFGMRGDVDRRNLDSAFESTKELFKSEFGIEYSIQGYGVTCADPCSSPCDAPKRDFDLSRPTFLS